MRQLFYGRYSLLRIYLSKWTALGYSQRYFDKLEFLDAYNMRKKLNSILNIVLSFTAIL